MSGFATQRLLSVVLAAMGCTVGSAAINDDDMIRAATRHLARTAAAQRDGSHLARLASLRQMSDPSLRPFFLDLIQSDQWQVQVHALLGLAEIDEAGQLDPWLVTQVDPRAREIVIANAIDQGLLQQEEIEELLSWRRLEPFPEALLLAEREGHDDDTVTRLAALADASEVPVAAIAAALLSADGQDVHLSALSDRLDRLSTREQIENQLTMLEVIREFSISGATTWVESLLQERDLPETVRFWAIYTMLTVDSDRGVRHWSRHVNATLPRRHRVRFALQLLESGAPPPPDAASRLGADDDDLLLQILSAAQSIDRNEGAVSAVNALIDTNHLKSLDWAIRMVRTLPTEKAKTIYTHMLDASLQQGATSQDAVAVGVSAATAIHELDPTVIPARLAVAEDDSLEQQVLLLSMLDWADESAAGTLKAIRRIGSSRADSLALLLLARSTEDLSDDDVHQLGVIAAGGGRLSDPLQVQAAWMYLQRTGELDQAMTEVSQRR